MILLSISKRLRKRLRDVAQPLALYVGFVDSSVGAKLIATGLIIVRGGAAVMEEVITNRSLQGSGLGRW